MGSSANPIANPLVVCREEFDDWAVLFNPDTGDAFGINPVGVAVWKMLDGGRGIEGIVAGLREQFGDVPGSAADDVRRYVEDLVGRGFVCDEGGRMTDEGGRMKDEG